MLLPFLHSSSAHLPFLIVKDGSHTEKSFELVLNGADRDRTDDIQLAKLALSQLSYSPVVVCLQLVFCSVSRVGQARLELATPRLSSVCSNQLSYWPVYSCVLRPLRRAALPLSVQLHL
jgi:hypothetical protein